MPGVPLLHRPLPVRPARRWHLRRISAEPDELHRPIVITGMFLRSSFGT